MPFIYYVPVDFERNLRGSFLFNPARPCIIKQNNKLYLYSDFQKGEFEYDEINIKENISAILISKDSTFVFSPRMDYGEYNGVVFPNAIQYIGYIQNDSVYYYNTRKILSIVLLILLSLKILVRFKNSSRIILIVSFLCFIM